VKIWYTLVRYSAMFSLGLGRKGGIGYDVSVLERNL